MKLKGFNLPRPTLEVSLRSDMILKLIVAISLVVLKPGTCLANNDAAFEFKGFRWDLSYEKAISNMEKNGGYFRTFMLEHPTQWRENRSVELYSLTEWTYTNWFFGGCDYYRHHSLHPRFILYGVDGVTAINWSIGGLPLHYMYHSPFKFLSEEKWEVIDRGENLCTDARGQSDPFHRNRKFRISPISYEDFHWFYFQGSTSPDEIENAIPVFTKQYGEPKIKRFKSRTKDSSVDNFIAEWTFKDGTRIQLTKHSDLVPLEHWRRNYHQVICDRTAGRREQVLKSIKHDLNLHRDEFRLISRLMKSDEDMRSSCRLAIRWGGVGEVLILSPTTGGIDARRSDKRERDF